VREFTQVTGTVFVVQQASIDDLETQTFSGRRFTKVQLHQIHDTIHTLKNLSRKELALTLCEHLSWRTATGSLKVNSCLTLLKQLEKRGLSPIPPPQEHRPKKRHSGSVSITNRSEPRPQIDRALAEIGPLKLQLVASGDELTLWNEYVARYHYLGYRRPFGSHLKYFIVAEGLDDEKVGCLLFAASAWALASRDDWIGWKPHHRVRRLNLIVSNSRFLIFPWINIPNLASKSLSLIPQCLGPDWQRNFGYTPVLMESFVDQSKFRGTCYQAANWQFLGQTSGRAGARSNERGHVTKKDIYVYPLESKFREILKGEPVRKAELASGMRTGQPLSVADAAFAELWAKIVQAVTEVASQFDKMWLQRRRVIDSMMLVLVIFRLVSNKDRKSYGSTIDELWENCGKMRIPLPQRDGVAASSFTEARSKLDASIFKAINQSVISAYEEEGRDAHLWRGHRIFAVDGSKLHLPRQLMVNGYKLPSPNAHYPQGLVSCLYQIKSKIPYDFDLVSHRHERKCALAHLTKLASGDLVVYDRGYFSYSMLHQHNKAGVHAVFRLKGQSYPVIASFRAGDKTDAIVTIDPGSDARRILKINHPDIQIKPLAMRLIKYRAGDTDYCLGTTLLDQDYEATAFADLYHSRWGIEELYKISKQTFAIEQFHAQSERGVKQELFAHFALITINRIFSNQVDENHRPIPGAGEDRPARTLSNFKNCVGVLLRNIEGLLIDQASRLQQTIKGVLASISRYAQKQRPNRAYPRRSMKPRGKWEPQKIKRAVPVSAMS